MTYEILDLVVVPRHGVALCHGLHRFAGRLRMGRQVDMWWRATQDCRSRSSPKATMKKIGIHRLKDAFEGRWRAAVSRASGTTR